MNDCDFTFVEHSVPVDAVLKDLKQCENCSKVFARNKCIHPKQQRCGCYKYCAGCRSHFLMPSLNEIGFQEELAAIAPELSKHAIRYDDSLLPVKKTRVVREERRNSWMAKLLLAYGENRFLTALEIARIMELSLRTPNSAINTARHAGFVFEVDKSYRPYHYALEKVIAVEFKFGRPVKRTPSESIYL